MAEMYGGLVHLNFPTPYLYAKPVLLTCRTHFHLPSIFRAAIVGINVLHNDSRHFLPHPQKSERGESVISHENAEMVLHIDYLFLFLSLWSRLQLHATPK